MIPSWKFYQTQWLTSMNSTFSWILIHPFSSGFGLSTVLLNYHNIQNIIYSLLTGRPVVVIGSAQFEEEIRGIVLALKLFVPGCHRYVWSWLPFVFGYILFKCKKKPNHVEGKQENWKYWRTNENYGYQRGEIQDQKLVQNHANCQGQTTEIKTKQKILTKTNSMNFTKT